MLKVRRGRWYIRFQHQGREVCVSTGLSATERNRPAAQAMEAAKRMEILTGQALPQPVQSQPFARAAADYLRWVTDVLHRSKPRSAARIAVSFASLKAHYGQTPVSQIDAPAIEDYKSWRVSCGIRDVTIRHDLHALSGFVKRWALPRRLCAANPLAGVVIPSDRDSISQHVISEAEERAYFAHAKGTLRDVAMLILLTGMRPEEVYSLRARAVDLAKRQLTVEGGKSRAALRTLPMCSEVVSILRARLKSSKGEWVFPSDRRPGQHVTKLNQQHDRACLDAGVSFRLYDLRHTWATRLAVGGNVSIATVAGMLGHANLRTVQRYVHPDQAAYRAAVDALEAQRSPDRNRDTKTRRAS